MCLAGSQPEVELLLASRDQPRGRQRQLSLVDDIQMWFEAWDNPAGLSWTPQPRTQPVLVPDQPEDTNSTVHASNQKDTENLAMILQENPVDHTIVPHHGMLPNNPNKSNPLTPRVPSLLLPKFQKIIYFPILSTPEHLKVPVSHPRSPENTPRIRKWCGKGYCTKGDHTIRK